MTDEPPEKMRERAERNGYKNGTKYGSLLSQIKHSEKLLTAEQKKQYEATGEPSQLNPRFVAEMMGFPVNWTVLPFQNGTKKV